MIVQNRKFDPKQYTSMSDVDIDTQYAEPNYHRIAVNFSDLLSDNNHFRLSRALNVFQSVKPLVSQGDLREAGNFYDIIIENIDAVPPTQDVFDTLFQLVLAARENGHNIVVSGQRLKEYFQKLFCNL